MENQKSTAGKRRMSPGKAKGFGALFAGVALLFVIIGWTQIASQHTQLRTFVPVQAAVTASTVQAEQRTDSKGRSRTYYRPYVSYLYEVNGAVYTSNRFSPTEETGKEPWAKGQADAYVPGNRYTAHHDPADPSNAYLKWEISFGPYTMVLFPMIHLCLGLGILLAGGLGWSKARVWGLATAIWFAVGSTAIIHYFTIARPPYEPVATIGSAAYVLIGLVGVYVWRRKRAGEATLSTVSSRAMQDQA